MDKEWKFSKIFLEINEFDPTKVEAEVLRLGKDHFAVEEFAVAYKRAVEYVLEGAKGFAKVLISKNGEGALFDYLDSRNGVNCYFFTPENVYCSGANEERVTEFYFDKYDSALIFNDSGSCWDCLDYEDHTTYRKTYRVKCDPKTGECSARFWTRD